MDIAEQINRNRKGLNTKDAALKNKPLNKKLRNA